MWKSRLLFLFAVLVAFGFTKFYMDYHMGLTVLYTLLLLGLLALLSIFMAKRAVQVTQVLDYKQGTKRQPKMLTIQVANNSPFYYPGLRFCYSKEQHLQYPEGYPDRVVLAPLRRAQYAVPFTANYRGVYAVGITQVIVTDFLGLFCCTLPTSPPDFTAYPLAEHVEQNTTLAQAQELGARQKQTLASDAELTNLRLYQPGDSIRHIHWNLYARHGELYTRVPERYPVRKALVWLDTATVLAPQPVVVEDLLVSHLAGVTAKLLEQQFMVDCIAGGSALVQPLTSVGQIPQLLAALATLKFAETENLPPVLAMGNNRLMVFCLHTLGEELRQYLVTAPFYSAPIVVYYIFPAKPKPGDFTFLQQLQQKGAIVHMISTDDTVLP